MNPVVAQSLPEFCVVCEGTGLVYVTWIFTTGRTMPLRVSCLHCHHRIPVLISKGVK